MRLILIRHGETLWNEMHRFQGFSDIGLSARGTLQARCLADSLKGEALSAIYTSSLLRARQTAEAIACHHGCPLIVEEDLKELNQGRLEGITGEELRRDFPEFLESWLLDPSGVKLPQGESLGDLQQRVWSAVERIVREWAGQTVAAVAHSFVNVTILCRVLDLPLKNIRRLRQDAAAKNVIDFLERGAVLRSWNDTCHLADLPPRVPE
ncbi:MAG: histidine phosphatase family protein [Deltaproteobacteria bacterium]|nr:histidine phosphatase family protein [Deltaproteobacteria bacterium]